MSLLSWLGKAVGGFVLVVSLGMAIGLFIASDATSPPTLRQFFVTTLVSQIPDATIDSIVSACGTRDSAEFQADSQRLSMDCTAIRGKSASEAKASLGEQLFMSLYEKSYPCSGALECIQTGNFLALVSRQGNQYFSSLLNFALVGMAAGIAIIALSLRKLGKILKSVGGSFVVSGMPVFFVLFGHSLLPVPEIVSGFVSSIFSTLALLYGSVLAIGIALYIAGRKLDKPEHPAKKAHQSPRK
jgi:hypothetical protein